MKLIYTEQALLSLEEALSFITYKVTSEKLIEIRDKILDTADTLLLQPLQGQKEPYLSPLRKVFVLYKTLNIRSVSCFYY